MVVRAEREARIIPLSGWYLDRIAHLDAVVPGLAGHVLRASRERRQVIAALLSVNPPIQCNSHEHTLAQQIVDAGHSEMLRLAFGVVPIGLRGALRRSGDKIHPPRFYQYLQLLLTRGDGQTILAIQEMPSLSLSRLRILRSLPSDLRLAGLTRQLRSIGHARDVAALVNLLAHQGVDRNAMADALSKISGPTAVASFASRWSSKISMPPHPVIAAEGYRPIQHAAELHHLALAYRNCLRTHLAAAMEGRSSFAELTHADGKAVAHLIRLSGSWVLDQIWGKDNHAPLPPVEDFAIKYLASHGIVQRDVWMRKTHAWSPLRRLTHVYDFGEDADITR